MILLAGIIVQYNLTDVMAFSTPPSLCATSPIALPHPAMLRGTAKEVFENVLNLSPLYFFGNTGGVPAGRGG